MFISDKLVAIGQILGLFTNLSCFLMSISVLLALKITLIEFDGLLLNMEIALVDLKCSWWS